MAAGLALDEAAGEDAAVVRSVLTGAPAPGVLFTAVGDGPVAMDHERTSAIRHRSTPRGCRWPAAVGDGPRALPKPP